MIAVYWITGLALVLFFLAAGLGKALKIKMAREAFDRMGVSHTMMSAFGGLELGAMGTVPAGMVASSPFFASLMPWAVAAIIGLQLVMLFWQRRAGEPFAAMVGPAFVIGTSLAFLLSRSFVGVG